jgi:hypothetical protein
VTKLLEIGAGRIVMRDTDDHVVFDSDEKLFQATAKMSGSISLGPWTAQAFWPSGKTNINTDIYHALGAINPACDTVVGAFRLTSTGSPAYGVGGLGWFNAGGTYVHYVQSASTGAAESAFGTFTFMASGGQLYLNERVVLTANAPSGNFTNTHQMLALTFDYQLYVGSFV